MISVNITNQDIQGYSVLMSVYYKEKPDFLYDSMNSIWNQTTKTDNFVLVCDGPLTEALDNVIEKMKSQHPNTLQVVRLEENKGLGNALNIGMKHCKHILVARMDSDDISRTDRCEKQLSLFIKKPEISICSGIVEEFTVTTDKIESRRVPPESQDKILLFAKKRNPFNHPCVMFRKDTVDSVGGYKDFYLLEDYYLWIRMLQNGYVGYNLQEPLLWMRAGNELYKRRSGLKYFKSQKALFRYMRDSGFITNSQYLTTIMTRFVSSLLPNRIRKTLFKLLLRKNQQKLNSTIT